MPCKATEPYHSDARALVSEHHCQGELILQSIIAEAGWPIWPLLLISVIALAIIIERLLSLRGARICPNGIANEAVRLYRSNSLDVDSLAKLRDACLAGQVLSTILENRRQPRAEIRYQAELAGSDVAHTMQRFLPALAMIATVAPLMGLFGTVIGMIEIFAAYQPGGTDPGQLARGISIALYNTGFGILIAVPAAIAHRLLRVHVDNLLVRIEQEARSVIDRLDT